jgi:hypothetical protein
MPDLIFCGRLYYYDTDFPVKTMHLRESGKTGSLKESKTPVKNAVFR